MLSHANFTSNSQASFERFGLQAGIVALSFLPLAHVYERLVDYGYLFNGVSVAYVARMEDVPQALLEVRPQVCAAVPRFFEKLYGNILERGAQDHGSSARHFRLGHARGARGRAVEGVRAAGFAGSALAMGGGQPAGVQEISRGRGRAHDRIHLRRRAAGARTGRILYRRGHAAVSGLWADGNVRR